MNKTIDLKTAVFPANTNVTPGLLFEMIRSFVTLAATLNLSHAVKDLGSTRQTVRRHISTLEDAMGVPLFYVDDRRYYLTVAGENALPDAKASKSIFRAAVAIHAPTVIDATAQPAK